MKINTLLTIILLGSFMATQAFGQEYQIIEDFEGEETIPINGFSNGWIGGDEDVESFEIIENPHQNEINPSDSVLQFNRAHDGDSWAGFWSNLPEPIDMTDKKYIHYQVWNPRESPARFKVEGGDETDNIEILPMEEPEVTEEWINYTFDFGAEGATGEYPTVNLQPDFKDTDDLDDDLVIYIDNIILSDSEEFPEEAIVSADGIGETPQAFNLEQNYPNPFNPTTQIQYTVSEQADVTLKVYDILGQEISTLVDERQTAGQYEVTFDGSGLSSGTYIYRLEAGEFSSSRTMMFVK